jgi:hypothetical protein
VDKHGGGASKTELVGQWLCPLALVLHGRAGRCDR